MAENIFQRMIVSEHLADTISRRFFDREKPESFPRGQNHISFALIRAAAVETERAVVQMTRFSPWQYTKLYDKKNTSKYSVNTLQLTSKKL